MDAIDITNEVFSLEHIPELNEVIGDINDNNIFMYIAIAISILILGFVLYRSYISNKKHVTFQDSNECFGDVCTR
jgi:TRAP-type C4-dicarboxylate transport system permease large subunit